MLDLFNKSLKFLFLAIVFVVFSSPVNSAYHIEIAGIKITYAEISFLILPLINILIVKKGVRILHYKNVKELGYAFLIYVVIIEFAKEVIIEGSIGDYFKSLRLAVPLLSAIVILNTGLRVNIRHLWKILLIVLVISNILAVFAFQFRIDRFLPPIEGFVGFGRLYNSNASLGVVGLFLLFESKKVWYNKGWLPLIAASFSLLGLLLSGNRTYIISLALFSIFLILRFYSYKILVRGTIIAGLVLMLAFILYSENSFIKYQVNMRIAPLVSGQAYVLEDAYYGSREMIVKGVIDHIEENNWILGLPYSEHIFDYGSASERYRGRGKMTMTDTSFINLLLRYGITSLVLFLLLLFWLYRGNLKSDYPSRIFIYTLPVFIFVSVNVDVFVRHNAIFFIFLTLYVSAERISEKSSTKYFFPKAKH